MRGPIDYIVVQFEGANFDGTILNELKKSVDAGIISVLAVSAINKNSEGVIQALDITEQEAIFASISPLDNSLIDEDDIQEVGEILKPGSGAGLLIVEQLWAKGLKQAIADAGGSLITEGRIHPDAEHELEEEV